VSPERSIVPYRSSGLVDVLDRILEKGLVVAGDVKISLAEVELLTIRIRLIVCSIDKAQEIGLDWWRGDRYFSGVGAAARAVPRAPREQRRTLPHQPPGVGVPGGSASPATARTRRGKRK
jgi:gas vesicle protein GvpA/GvpJ/GvpM family